MGLAPPPMRPADCAPQSARMMLMTHCSCHTHWVQAAPPDLAMGAKKMRERTWNATVCLVKASSDTPKWVRPRTRRPKLRPTMRAKKPGAVVASPRGLAQYGS